MICNGKICPTAVKVYAERRHKMKTKIRFRDSKKQALQNSPVAGRTQVRAVVTKPDML